MTHNEAQQSRKSEEQDAHIQSDRRPILTEPGKLPTKALLSTNPSDYGKSYALIIIRVKCA
jgi:hypothetical protein